MGASVIDSLVVELKLDPSQFKKGEQEALDSIKGARDGFKKAGEGIEESGKAASAVLVGVRGALLELLAVFIGTKDIVAFGNEIRESNTHLGRLSLMLDQNVQSLSSWGNAATAAGGSAEDAYGTFQSLTSSIQETAITGQSNVLPFFKAMGIELVNADGSARNLNDVLIEMSKWAQGKDPARAAEYFRNVGVSEGLIPLLLQSPDKVERLLAAMKRYAPTQEDVRAASALTVQYGLLDAAVGKLGSTYLTELTPGILGTLRALQQTADWLIAHPTPGGIAAVGATAAASIYQSAPAWLKPILSEGAIDLASLDPTSGLAALLLSQLVADGTASTSAIRGTADISIPVAGQRLLGTISSAEGADYNSLYGKNRTFDDFSHFPNSFGGIGPGGQPTHAAGRYQFEPGTWARAAKALGLKDFSPASQDKAAWWLATTTYAKATHRDLLTDLGSKDQKVLDRIAAVLSTQWASLPHGSQQRLAESAWLKLVGAQGAALSSGATTHSATTNNHSRETHIGTINVNAPKATDANGIAKGIGGALNSNGMLAQGGPQ